MGVTQRGTFSQRWRLWWVVFAIVSMLPVSWAPTQAAVVEDLYAARVPVADRSSDALAVSAKEALSQVLVKVSGSASVLRNPKIREALNSARANVQQYAYVRGDQAAQDTLADIEFSADYVTDMVRRAGEPLWTANRPPVLAWVVVESGGQREFLSRARYPVESARLEAAFSRRGLDLRLPSYDGGDAAAISTTRAWQGDQRALLAASERYGLNDVALGRLRRSGDTASVDWVYYFDGDKETGRRGQGSVDEAWLAGANMIADNMAGRFAVVPGDEFAQPVRMVVSGVYHYSDYAQLIRWVTGLEPIASARVERVQGDRLELNLGATGRPEQLRAILEMNDRLVPSDDPGVNSVLRYRWQN